MRAASVMRLVIFGAVGFGAGVFVGIFILSYLPGIVS